MTQYLAWKADPKRFFGEVGPEIEKLRDLAAGDPYEMVETSYFGFNIPDANINGEIYFWYHPHLKVASGGVIIQKGLVNAPSRAEFCDWRTFMPIPDDITDCTYATGLRVAMTDPQKVWDISFDAPDADTSLRLHLEGLCPPPARATGGHICQPMKTSGTLRLRGEDFVIDGYTTRDRSWGDPRPETTQKIPPVSWCVPIFNDNLAFHVIGFDSPELVPGWMERYPSIANGRNLLWGYVWEDGRLLGVKACKKRTVRDVNDYTKPVWMTVEITDELDRVHHLTATIVSGVEISPWQNMLVYLAGARWTYKDMTTYGDIQEAMFPQYYTEA